MWEYIGSEYSHFQIMYVKIRGSPCFCSLMLSNAEVFFKHSQNKNMGGASHTNKTKILNKNKGNVIASNTISAMHSLSLQLIKHVRATAAELAENEP